MDKKVTIPKNKQPPKIAGKNHSTASFAPIRRLEFFIYFVLPVFVVVLLFILVFALPHLRHSSSGGQSGQTNLSENVTSQDNFTIDFSGVPKMINVPSGTLNGITFSGRVYDLPLPALKQEQDVAVYNYYQFDSGILSKKQTISDLQSLLASIGQSYNSSVSGSQTTNFDNLTAVQATLVPLNPNDENRAFIILFPKASNIYAIMDIGASKSDFNKFVSSFSFLYSFN
jgi:hypothetical protein